MVTVFSISKLGNEAIWVKITNNSKRFLTYLPVTSQVSQSVAKCRGSWVVGGGRGSWVWVWLWVNVVGKKKYRKKIYKIKEIINIKNW